MAWQQDDDIYSSSGYALAAAMELHARVTNANLDNNMAAMPPGFKLYSAMPTPPAGAIWRFGEFPSLCSSPLQADTVVYLLCL